MIEINARLIDDMTIQPTRPKAGEESGGQVEDTTEGQNSMLPMNTS